MAPRVNLGRRYLELTGIPIMNDCPVAPVKEQTMV